MGLRGAIGASSCVPVLVILWVPCCGQRRESPSFGQQSALVVYRSAPVRITVGKYAVRQCDRDDRLDRGADQAADGGGRGDCERAPEGDAQHTSPDDRFAGPRPQSAKDCKDDQ